MTPPTTGTSREERFFIRKNGAYYRPNSRGYTTSAISAGRYTQEEAEKITHPNGPDGPRDGMSYIAEHICPDEDWQEYRAVCAERDALRDQLAAARNEALEEVKRSMMGFAHEHADHWSEEFAQGAETQTIGLIGVVDALKSTTPAPSQGFTEVISGINQGAASICPDIKPEEDVTHADDYAVNRFSVVMKAKLGRKRSEGRHGWNDKQQCSQKFLSDLLRAHVEKGDPVDVANFAMMLQQRGEAILPAPREVTVQEAARVLLGDSAHMDDKALFALTQGIRNESEWSWEPTMRGSAQIAQKFLRAIANEEQSQ